MRALVAVAAILSVLFFSACSTVSYIVQAGLGQWAIYNHERQIEEVLSDPHTPTRVREKLAWVPEIRQFVEAELGVKSTSNYKTYVDLKRRYVVWALTSAEKYELKTKEWSFPIVGSFPYLGFFKEKSVRKWEEDERRLGRDTHVRGVQAYSTLGYLRDPLLSSMLSSKKESMVNLLFHETAHAYIFIKGEGSFNEQAASFVGDYGELLWIEKKHGKESAVYREWWADREDRRTFGALIRSAAESLKKEYARTAGLSEEERSLSKERAYAALGQRFLSTAWKSEFWKEYAKNRLQPEIKNNAALLAHLTYEDNQSTFDLVHTKCKGSLLGSLAFLKSYSENWEVLRSRAERSRSVSSHDKDQSSSSSKVQGKETSSRLTPQEVLKDVLIQAGCVVGFDLHSH